MTKKEFFKAMATALLMPAAVLFGASVGAIIAVLAAVLIYSALLYGAARWLALRVFGFLKSFGKAARTGEVSEGRRTPEPPTAACGLPGDFPGAYSGKGDPSGTVPEPPRVGSTTSFPSRREWLQ